MTTFSKKYEPEIFEKEVYKKWEENGMFLPHASRT
jgi:valyl-tRNA synthetase